MSKPILVANWKNHPSSLNEAKALLTQISRQSQLYKKLFFFIAPPLSYFESVSARPKSFIRLAVQNIFSTLRSGSYTGEVTPDILKSFGVKLAIIGHSERRAMGETSEDVSRKVKMAIRSGIIPLVCVGEVTRDQDGEYFEFLREELELSLASLNRKSDISNLVIAYEPVWAIGKNATDAMETTDLSESVIFIKKILTNMFGRAMAERVPILYGGSVEPSNADLLIRGTGIKGFLVGHASLDAKSLGFIAKSLISK
jgi:triosephosphate isomerase